VERRHCSILFSDDGPIPSGTPHQLRSAKPTPSPTNVPAHLHVPHALKRDGPKGAVLAGDDPLVPLRAGALAQHQGADAVGVAEGDEADALDEADAGVGALGGCVGAAKGAGKVGVG
jgi:hypothetical protein